VNEDDLKVEALEAMTIVEITDSELDHPEN